MPSRLMELPLKALDRSQSSSGHFDLDQLDLYCLESTISPPHPVKSAAIVDKDNTAKIVCLILQPR